MSSLVDNSKMLYVDIDRTLIEDLDGTGTVASLGQEDVVLINGYPYKKKFKNIEIVKKFGHHTGLKIIFWSAGGGQWAFDAADALGLSKYGIAFLSKPSWYLDDLENAGFFKIEGTWIDALHRSPKQ